MPSRYLILFLIIASFTGCDFTSADTYLQESKLAVEREDYRGAIELLNKAIRKNSTLKEAYLQRGLCYQKIVRKDSAISDFKTLLGLDSSNTSAWYYTGLCKYSQDKFNEAIRSYNRALLTKGITNLSDTSAFTNIADTNTNGIYKATAFDIPVAQLYYQRGLAYYATDQILKAYYDFKTCTAQKYNLDECSYLSSLCRIAINKSKNDSDAVNINSANEKNIAKYCLSHLCR